MPEINEHYQYLNRLRESGVTNMFGAAPYLADAFGLSRREAQKILGEWMRWVEENPDNRDL